MFRGPPPHRFAAAAPPSRGWHVFYINSLFCLLFCPRSLNNPEPEQFYSRSRLHNHYIGCTFLTSDGPVSRRSIVSGRQCVIIPYRIELGVFNRLTTEECPVRVVQFLAAREVNFTSNPPSPTTSTEKQKGDRAVAPQGMDTTYPSFMTSPAVMVVALKCLRTTFSIDDQAFCTTVTLTATSVPAKEGVNVND